MSEEQGRVTFSVFVHSQRKGRVNNGGMDVLLPSKVILILLMLCQRFCHISHNTKQIARQWQ